MQFENFDNKVKQAAEQHHPNYDEKAWGKMEKLLDKHLPRKKDRRRFIFFLLLFALLGGGTWLFISKPWIQTDKTSDTNTIQEKSVTDTEDNPSNKANANPITQEKEIDASVVKTGNENSPSADLKNDIPVIPGNNKSIQNKPVVSDINSQLKAKDKNRNNLSRQGISKPDELNVDIANAGKAKKNNRSNENMVTIPPISNDDNKTLSVNNDIEKQTNRPADKIITEEKKNDPGTKKDEVAEQQKPMEVKNIAKINKSKKGNMLFFTFSAGPDISYVDVDNPGKLKLVAGAGLGYTFNNRLTIRAGFYSAKKVYTASKYDYKPAIQPPNPRYLNDEIKADCKIHEIPVSLAYRFGKSEKQNFFASAGLSSLIMKKETYHYIYTYPGNPNPYPYTKKVNNENKHYFSVLTLSGGYQRRINKVLSIAAEPYVKLPLTGIGYGKIKLKSTGVLFSVGINPFTK